MNAANSLEPLFHSAPPKRRGRPPGAKALVVREPRALGIHHFAFVRSTLLGLDLRQSFARYLQWSESTTDLRHIEHRRQELLKQIINAGRLLDATLPAESKVTQLLDLLRSEAPAPSAVQLPTLEQWLEDEGMDPDFYCEADLIAEYKAAFGLDNAEAQDGAEGLADPAQARVRALNHLESVLAVSPAVSDRIDLWFARPIVKCLRNEGVITLQDLVNFINVYGFRWHARVAGFGAERAGRVVAWLRAQQDSLNVIISDAVDEPKALRALRRASGISACALVNRATAAGLAALERTYCDALAGGEGTFRSHMSNTLGAANDQEAVAAWLSRYNEKPATLRSYRKEVERFMLWCTSVLAKPVSSITAPDCQAYRAFLQEVPPTWINPLPLARTDPQWRAFRGQPGPASIKQALVIIQTMYEGLRDAGYLVANPMRSLMKSFNLPASKVDIRRAFTEAEWANVLKCLDAMPAGAQTLRLKCILELLVTSGMRLDELAKARRAHMRLESLADLPETWVLTVTGKRAKKREIPLAEDVVRLLATHGKEFMEEDKILENTDSLPLIRTLGASVQQWGRAENGALEKKSLSATPGTALSPSGIYTVLKRFFAHVAKTAPESGLQAERFQRASTHWMRHTFVRQALVDGTPIEVVSELAGHSSIDTTSIYSTQELARKIKAVQAMKRRVAA